MKLVFFIIFFLNLGGLGGSFQPTRLLILGSLLFIINIKKNHIKFNSTIKYTIYLYFIWIVYGIVSLLWSPDSVEGLKSEIVVMTIGMLSIIIFPLLLQNSEKSLKLIRNGWIFGLLFTVPFGLYEIITLNHFEFANDDRILGGIGYNVPFAAIFFGNYNNYCVYICLCLPMLYWAIFESNKKLLKLFYLSLLLYSLVIIIINTNRTSIVVFIIYLLCLLKLNLKSLALVVGLPIVLYILFSVLPESMRNTIEVLYNYRYNVDYATDTSGLIRQSVFTEGLNFLVDSHFLGVGAGGFETEMLNSKNYEGISNPHNLFLEILAQYGIIIFGLFILWMRKLFYTYKENKTLSRMSKRIFYTSLFLIPLIGIINSSALGYTYWWIYFSSLIMIATIENPQSSSKSVN